MGVALLLNVALLVALAAAAGYVSALRDGWFFVVLFLGLTVAGAVWAPGHRPRRARHELQRAEHLSRQVTRLCLAADLPEPELELVFDDAPLSWTTAFPGRAPRLHVTTGMALLLPERELEAVLAHELSHLGNRDAMLMTLLSAPGVFVLRGLRAAATESGLEIRMRAALVAFGIAYSPIALASVGLSRIVSRHRELAADRGAAVLTGSPAALASALRRLSDGLHAIPDHDLRVIASGDVLHVVPARPARGIGRLWATHPPLATRIVRLERLEARLQA